MGCCQSNESPTPTTTKLQTRSPSLTRQFTSKNQNTITKKFTNQVEYLKSFSSIVDSILKSGQKSLLDYQKMFDSFSFYFSDKSTDCIYQVPADLTCGECFISYNEEEEIPLSLACGHSLCKVCCLRQFKEEQMVSCPLECPPTLDSPEGLIRNDWILNRAKALRQARFCFEHESVADWFCVTCKVTVCEECDHGKHLIVKLASSEFLKEFVVWQRNLEGYLKTLEENEKVVFAHRSRFVELKEVLFEALERHLKDIKEAQVRVRNAVIGTTQDHLDEIQGFAQEMKLRMPIKDLKLFIDVVSAEIEKAKEVNESVASMKPAQAVKELRKVCSKANSMIEAPNFSPWEDCCKILSSEKNFEYFIIAMASIRLAT